MRCLAIGDIHRCINSLDTLLSAIGPRPDDQIVTLGDYVNRGPDSRAVIQRLLQVSERVPLISLLGNHEQMMLEAADSAEKLEEFLRLRWERFESPAPHESGKVMVCGHTAQRTGRPKNLGHAICIDTHAHGGGWLTCLDTHSGQVWQANEECETRRSQIEDYLENEYG